MNKVKKNKEKIISGIPASPGIAEGKAIIVNSIEDMKKFISGSILVAPLTSPAYMPIIVKAKAIVTDEGGITSHAAIVSRELHIPCVVGTKTATKSINDGDLIKVDGTKGIVIKL